MTIRASRLVRSSVAAAVVLAACTGIVDAPVRAQDQRPGQSGPGQTAASVIEHPHRAMYSAFVAAVEQMFVHQDRLQRLNWRNYTDEVWPVVAATKTEVETAQELNKILAKLQTSHTQVFTREEPEYYIIADVFGLKNAVADIWSGPPMLAGVGTFTAVIDGRNHVTHVLEGSPADTAGIKVGDEIVSVDGGRYSPVAAFRGKAGRTSVLEVRKTRDGETIRVEVPVVLMQPTAAFDQAAVNSARVIERGGKRIGYVHLWQMRERELLASALAAIDSTRSIYRTQRDAGARGSAAGYSNQPDKPLDAVIIDNRTKIGGSGEVGTHYLEVLTARRGGTIVFSNRHNRRDLRPQPTSFAGRSVMLVDGGTRSAAELFAFGFEREKIGPLIGTKTAGAVTGGWATRLPGGLLLYLGTSSVMIEGQTLEGRGVEPTMKVERSIPYSGGADAQLDAAVNFLVGE